VDHPQANLQIRQGAYLPHWTLTQGGVYAVTFRLGDSLPKAVLERLRHERAALEADVVALNGILAKQEEQRLARLCSEKIEAYLDAGSGSCWLRQADIADMVAAAILHFDGARYRIHAWCVMPNHVHVLVELPPGIQLAGIVHSWKSFTAKAANARLGRTGEFWQPEYFDHLIRDQADFAHAVRYIEQNPVMAGLTAWRWVSGTGAPPVETSEHGRDARATAP